MTIQQIAATDVVTAERDTNIATIVDRMAEEDVGAIVIVEGNSPVGVVTDRSIALALGDADDLGNTTADQLMSEHLVTVRDGDGIFDVIRTLGEEGIRRAPVVDEEGTLEGIVSLDDMVVLLAEEFDNLSDVIEQQSPRL